MAPARDEMQRPRLYRARDGRLGGVCAGIAKRYSTDPDMVRLITVLLTVLTAGAALLAYLVLWLVLPCEQEPAREVDGRATVVSSEAYGAVPRMASGATPGAANAANTAGAASAADASPDAPPQAALGAVPGATSGAAPSAISGAAPSAFSNAALGATSGALLPHGPQASSPGLGVAIALLAGIVALVAAMAVSLSSMTRAFNPEQFWPLILVAAGIARMVLPDASGRHGLSTALGMALFFIGMVLLLGTLGLAQMNWQAWLFEGAPLLFASGGFLLMGRGLDSSVLTMCGVAAIALFCLVGIVFYLEPGTVQRFMAWLPNGRAVSIVVVQ